MTMTDEGQVVMIVPEVAVRVRLGLATTYRLVREGRIRSIRVGKRILVPSSAVREFLEGA